MATIGTFKKTDQGFSGVISTLALQSHVSIAPVAKSNATDPDYQARIGDVAIGHGWTARNDSGQLVIKVTLDDPSFARPINGTLIEAVGHYRLVWSR
jgi:uncharacterized protein (DUF736 family)